MASWQPFWESSLIMSKDRFAPKVTLSPRGRSDVQAQFCVISECYLVPPISFPNLTDTPLEQLFTSWKCEFGSLDWDSGICHFHFCLSLLFQGSSIILGYVVLGQGCSDIHEHTSRLGISLKMQILTELVRPEPQILHPCLDPRTPNAADPHITLWVTTWCLLSTLSFPRTLLTLRSAVSFSYTDL